MQPFTDLEATKRSRDQAKLYNTDRFYDEQANALAQWEWGEKPPEGLVLGSLPYVNLRAIRRESNEKHSL